MAVNLAIVHESRTDVQDLSPRILRASCMSLGMMVTRLAWIAQRLVSSKRPTMQASEASWRARTAELWKRRSCLKAEAMSRTSLWKGSLRMRSSVDFWNLRISRRETVPGLNLWGRLTPPARAALAVVALAAMCLRGCFPPADLRAVILVRVQAAKRTTDEMRKVQFQHR